MKNFKVNAKVLVNFNDKKNLNDKGEPTLMEVGEVIKDMPRDRFEELESLGYVEEDKSFTSKSKEDKEWE